MTFFEKYTYRQKYYAFIVISLLLFAASYKRVFKTTIETRDYISELALKKENLLYLANDIYQERSFLTKLDKLLGKQNSTIDQVQKNFLVFFDQHAEGLIVFQMDEVLKFEHPDFVIHTHRIMVRGNFLETIQFTDKLEKKFDLARLTHISMEKTKMNQEENEQLYTTLLLQNYENKK